MEIPFWAMKVEQYKTHYYDMIMVKINEGSKRDSRMPPQTNKIESRDFVKPTSRHSILRFMDSLRGCVGLRVV